MIQNHLFYVDKTHFIKEWWENGDSVTLITRPRRFGKTLNNIHGHLSVGGPLAFIEAAGLQEEVIFIVQIRDGLAHHLPGICKQPCLNICKAQGDDRIGALIVDFMRALFNSTFKTNPFLERAIMTGITRVSKESIFSDLNFKYPLARSRLQMALSSSFS